MTRSTKLAAAMALAFLAAPASAALKTGDQAPQFSAPAYLAGNPFQYSLADALTHGPVVLYFFPAAHTAGCNLEAHLFSEAIDDFKAAGASVIGVTAGNIDALADFSRETEPCGGKLPVAADPDAKIAREYDTILDKKPEWSSRTSYVIAPDGEIVLVHSDNDWSEHVTRTLAAVQALRAS